ncbi:MAG: zinc ribbon domain-containing protein, partial [Chloroflexi bacterium]|nr:zinc ribbon domain-containing protein [Chloroflexota bacterium]
REGKHRGAIGASVYLLSGTLRCGHCGAAMAANNKGSRRYYSCTGRRNPGSAMGVVGVELVAA